MQQVVVVDENDCNERVISHVAIPKIRSASPGRNSLETGLGDGVSGNTESMAFSTWMRAWDVRTARSGSSSSLWP
jgi:hypothetical protein